MKQYNLALPFPRYEVHCFVHRSRVLFVRYCFDDTDVIFVKDEVFQAFFPVRSILDTADMENHPLLLL